MADRVGVRELRQNLSRYLERVKKGEYLIVTERGREVARLVPGGTTADAELVERYGAIPATADLTAVWDALPRIPSPPGTTDALLEVDRGPNAR